MKYNVMIKGYDCNHSQGAAQSGMYNLLSTLIFAALFVFVVFST